MHNVPYARPVRNGLPIFILAILVLVTAFGVFTACNESDNDAKIPPPTPNPDADDDTAVDDDDDDADCTDADNDGWCVPEDCQDNNPFANPGSIEQCDDGIDNDCNGFSDREDPACPAIDDDDDDDDDFVDDDTDLV